MDNLVFPSRSQVTIAGRSLPRLPGQWKNLVQAVIATARITPDKIFAYDSDGSHCTFKDAVTKSAALAQILHRQFGRHVNIGILMPPSIHGALVNLAVMMSGNAVVDLNLLSVDIVNMVIGDAHIDGVLTAKGVNDKLGNPELGCGKHFVEELFAMISVADLERASDLIERFNLKRPIAVVPGVVIKRSDTAAIMYTSGSTGIPKGAELTHANVLSNIWQIKHHLALTGEDKLLGVLPFFHSFGFTVTLWAVLVLGLQVVYHPSALDSRAIAKLVEEFELTIVISTPSLIRMALPRLSKEGFKSVRLLLLGSEKLKPELSAAIYEKLNLTAYEGYGCTELSPVVSANVPQSGKSVAVGSVGQALPGTDIAIMDIDTGKLLSRHQDGLIFARGPQVMKCYFNKPGETSLVLQNGWYFTGDVGHVDDEGRLFLTDRMNRIIKMGGEWVPLASIEAAIRRVCGITEVDVATVGVPDEVKGERPVVLYTKPDIDVAAMCKTLAETELPPMWVPKSKDFFVVEALPVAATGKLDLKEMKRLALAFLQASEKAKA